MQFLFSSIGKKIQIAITGILLCFFLIFHLMNNLVLFAGRDAFNSMVGFLESIKPAIRIMEFSLLFILIVHIINGIIMTFSNKAKRKIGYNIQPGSQTSSVNSRTMILSGSIILLFLIVHLGYIWLTYQTMPTHNYFSILIQDKIGYLGNLPTAIFYIISIIFIGFHLRHGFQSALKTMGVLASSKLRFLYYISFLFWGIIPLGFILIILSIQFGIIK